MRYLFFAGILCPIVFFAACEDGPIRSSYRPVLPELPRHWEEILGEPHWRLEWIDEAASWQEWEGKPGPEAPAISLLAEWASPVLAWPFWPEWNLFPGMMRPSGALFPWDTGTAGGDKLLLSWQGGVDALFWKEMAAADRPSAAAEGRPPWYFDWPRFRELLESEDIKEDVRRDPWLADWKEISRKTVESGFDRRRIVSRKFTQIVISGLGGYWIGSSPFAPPLDAEPDGTLHINAADITDTWVSSGGILKCSTSGWVFIARR